MSRSMNRVLITGAAGGIGSCIARQLAGGTGLLLTDVRPGPLEVLARDLQVVGADVATIAADVTSSAGRDALVQSARATGVDALINVAGVNPFGLVTEQTPEEIERTILINTTAPMLLCRALIPVLVARERAHVINVGSVFGSLGYPGFAAYSASKFALRGFTEALRRELADTSIAVHYLAPRATRTPLVTDRVRALNEELGVAMDAPESVAIAVERILRSGQRELILGFPEKLFVRINALLPGLVDRAIRKQLPVIRRHAARMPTPEPDRAGASFTSASIGVKS